MQESPPPQEPPTGLTRTHLALGESANPRLQLHKGGRSEIHQDSAHSDSDGSGALAAHRSPEHGSVQRPHGRQARPWRHRSRRLRQRRRRPGGQADTQHLRFRRQLTGGGQVALRPDHLHQYCWHHRQPHHVRHHHQGRRILPGRPADGPRGTRCSGARSTSPTWPARTTPSSSTSRRALRARSARPTSATRRPWTSRRTPS